MSCFQKRSTSGGGNLSPSGVYLGEICLGGLLTPLVLTSNDLMAATAAVGTHPTGIHSCFYKFYHRYSAESRTWTDKEIARIIHLIVRPTLVVFGTTGNILSFYIMRRSSLKHLSTCFYMSFLALADTGKWFFILIASPFSDFLKLSPMLHPVSSWLLKASIRVSLLASQGVTTMVTVCALDLSR